MLLRVSNFISFANFAQFSKNYSVHPILSNFHYKFPRTPAATQPNEKKVNGLVFDFSGFIKKLGLFSFLKYAKSMLWTVSK